MTRYMVPIYTSVGTAVEVEADSPEEAVEQVWESDGFQNLGGLCHACEHAVGSLGDWEVSVGPDGTTEAYPAEED